MRKSNIHKIPIKGTKDKNKETKKVNINASSTNKKIINYFAHPKFLASFVVEKNYSKKFLFIASNGLGEN